MNFSTRIVRRDHQLGLSMTELLVALAISSFLILGITQIYIDNKLSYLYQQNQSNNQENKRFLDLLLENYLNKAGFRRSPAQLPEYAFDAVPANSDCQAFAKEQAVTPAKGGVGICLRYFPLVKGELDCTANATPAFDDTKAYTPNYEVGSPVVMTLRYEPDQTPKGLDGKLVCKVGNTSVELLTGIADFRMTFGTSTTLDRKISSIVKFSDWKASSGNIMQISYSALIASGNKSRPSTDSLALSNWNKDSSSAEKTRLSDADKGQLFEIASNTLAMRNLMP